MFVNLAKLVCNVEDYQQAIELAGKGSQYNLDLKVGDIYPEKDDRVSSDFRELTAASFGKLGGNLEQVDKSDFLRSLLGLIGENVVMIASNMARRKETDKIVYGGGLLEDNQILKEILTRTTELNNLKAIYPEKPMYLGAVGALKS